MNFLVYKIYNTEIITRLLCIELSIKKNTFEIFHLHSV